MMRTSDLNGRLVVTPSNRYCKLFIMRVGDWWWVNRKWNSLSLLFTIMVNRF